MSHAPPCPFCLLPLATRSQHTGRTPAVLPTMSVLSARHAPSTTELRVHLQARVNENRILDARAKARNKKLVDEAQRALALVRAAKEQADATAASVQAHTQLQVVESELSKVQARRELAKAEFAAEIAAKDEAARAKLQLAAELELERHDEIERDAVRVGVGVEVAAVVPLLFAGTGNPDILLVHLAVKNTLFI